MLVHGDNILSKERSSRKYSDAKSQKYLREIRARYDEWHKANVELIGPRLQLSDDDSSIIERRVELLNEYKDFIDIQKYAEHFDSRSNLHSSVIEEFMYYLFSDLVSSFSGHALVGKSHSFKDIFFMPSNYAEMVRIPNIRVEKKDHDFIIGARIKVIAQVEGSRDLEEHILEVPAVAIECKTYLDKTMLEASSTAAEQLKMRNPNAIYLVAMEWIKLTENVNLKKFKVDQIYVLRKQKNTDREFRFEDGYVKNPIYADAVTHMYETVRTHLSDDWTGGIGAFLDKGYLLS